MSLKLIVGSLVLLGSAVSSAACLKQVTLRTTHWVYQGRGLTMEEATQNAVDNCIQDGTMSSACESGNLTYRPNASCQVTCRLLTRGGLWIYRAAGLTPEECSNNAVDSCVQDGTMPDACQNGQVTIDP